MIYASYDRSFQPNHFQIQAFSLVAGTLGTILSHPFEFIKTKTQVVSEGIGFRGRGNELGYNSYKILN